MQPQEKRQLFKQIMWDYNIPPEAIEDVFAGKSKTAGHYTEETLFIKLLESYSWYTIIDLLGLEKINLLLTQKVIQRLRTPELRRQYEYVRERLHEHLPAPG